MARKIDFFIIGAQKSATTALYTYLGQHPEIYLPKVKESRYFTKDEFYEQGTGYLDSYYRDIRGERIIGGAYANLMYFPLAAQRLFQHNPNIKLIAILRDPVQRAYSGYWFARRNGWEVCDTFEAALNAETERLDGTPHERSELTYLDHGRYADQLRPFLALFGRDRVMVILNEDLHDNPEASVPLVLSWLGADLGLGNIDVRQRVHESGRPRFPRLQRWYAVDDAPMKRAYRRLVPGRLRYLIRSYVVARLMRMNIRPWNYPPMKPETERRLRVWFAPYNKDLAELTGRNLDAWASGTRT